MSEKRVRVLPKNLSLDVLFFTVSILLLLSLSLGTILLLIFPFITFGFAFTIRLGTNKLHQDYSKNFYPVFHKKLLKTIGTKFSYVTIITIIFTYWISLDSFVFPQLILNHSFFFVIIFMFVFSFPFYWIFAEIWKHYNFNDIFEGIEIDYIPQDNHKTVIGQLDLLLSILKLNKIRKIYLINSLLYVVINIINVLLSIFTFINIVPGITIILAGTGFESSPPISLPYSSIIAAIVIPLAAITSLVNLKKKVREVSKQKITECINEIPKEIQTKLVDNINRLSNFYEENL